MAHFTNQTDFFEQTNNQITYVRLSPVQSQPRLGGTRVVIAMPILALKKLHEAEPSHIAAGVLANRSVGLTMTDAVYEARGVKREDQANRAQPEEGSEAEIQSAEV